MEARVGKGSEREREREEQRGRVTGWVHFVHPLLLSFYSFRLSLFSFIHLSLSLLLWSVPRPR